MPFPEHQTIYGKQTMPGSPSILPKLSERVRVLNFQNAESESL
jgi:hypothetical protein